MKTIQTKNRGTASKKMAERVQLDRQTDKTEAQLVRERAESKRQTRAKGSAQQSQHVLHCPHLEVCHLTFQPLLLVLVAAVGLSSVRLTRGSAGRGSTSKPGQSATRYRHHGNPCNTVQTPWEPVQHSTDTMGTLAKQYRYHVNPCKTVQTPCESLQNSTDTM